ncbi:MAG: Vi polysaccharide biosynthesis UDP-N-acetylglucosamine C-6 dehydrogenase TviB, partial [Pseudomonadota bacterium]
MADTRIGVLGLGYVGLPLALAFSRLHTTIGFDVDESRVAGLKSGSDVTGEVDAAQLQASELTLTANPADLAVCSVYIVTVPTPIDADRRPDLHPLGAASGTIGELLKPGDIVIYES